MLNASWFRASWRKAWPAWLFAGAIACIYLLMVLGSLPSLQRYRISDMAVFDGAAFLVIFGLPLLVAWAAWAIFSIRHWAGRLGLYLLFLAVDLGLCVWLFLNMTPPQM